MSKILRKATAQVPTSKSYGSFRTLLELGPRIYWGDSSSFMWSSQVDPNYHRLFHQMDISYPHKERFSKGKHQLPRGYHSEVWLSQQNYH
jgi:hypothetical protein